MSHPAFPPDPDRYAEEPRPYPEPAADIPSNAPEFIWSPVLGHGSDEAV